MPIRCRRSVGYPAAAVWRTEKEEYAPSASRSNSGDSVFTPEVCSHSFAHESSSRPDDFSSAVSRSVNSELA